MHSPEYLLHVSEGAEDISEMLHNEIIKRIIDRIMLRIGRGDDYILTAQDKWQLETLQQAGFLLEDIQKEIAQITKLQQKEIAEAMEEAGVKALEYDADVYRSAGLDPKPFTQSPELIRIAQRNYEATMGELRNFTRTMAQQSQQLFIKECDRAYNLVATGAMSYTEAVKEVINNVVTDGVTVTYPSGRTDTIETATLRAVRTGISQMSAQVTDARMEEMDWDIILVSSHLGARVTDEEDYKNHYWWQGKFYSKSGKDKRFSPFSVCGCGKIQGLCGANCRHSYGPGDGEHNPFENYDSEENRNQYEKEQRQRTLERRIRDTKREVMGLKEAVDNCKDEKAKFELDLQYQKKAALLAKQNKVYKEYCESNNLIARADRIQIAKWDRQQANAARGAAQRYKNSHGGNVTRNKATISYVEKQPFLKINTIDEAKEALLNRVGFNHVDNISGINDELFIENTKQLVKLEDKFGAIHKSSFTRFDDTNHANAVACAESGYATPHIQNLSLCRSHYFDKNNMIQNEKKWVDSKWSSPCLEKNLPVASLTHEYGHMIQNNLVAQAMRKAGWDENNYFAFMDRKAKSARAKFKWYIEKRKEVQDMCYNEIIAIAKEKNPLFVIEDNISDYGKTNNSEFFAEVFANSQLGKPNELGYAMNEWLKRKGLVIE